MSVSSISSVTDPYQTSDLSSTFQKVRSDFSDLSTAFQSGDLAQAQQAFATLQSDLPSNISNTPGGQALSAVGQALQSGDLSGAQQAFQALQNQAAQGHHHHHHHGSGASAQSAPPSSPTSTPTLNVGSNVNLFA